MGGCGHQNKILMQYFKNNNLCKSIHEEQNINILNNSILPVPMVATGHVCR